MKAIEVLKGASNLLADRKKWIKGSYAKTARGNTNIEPNDPEAVKFCAMGALFHTAGTTSVPIFKNGKAVYKAEQYLVDANNLKEGLASFNDHSTTKHRTVLEAFEKAINYAQNKKKK